MPQHLDSPGNKRVLLQAPAMVINRNDNQRPIKWTLWAENDYSPVERMKPPA
jgi:hypothetical protein